LNIWRVFIQILHLSSKLSETAKKRPMTASSPIHIAQSIAKPKIKAVVLENLFSLPRSLKKRVIKLKERRRLKIPILDAVKRRARIMIIIPKIIRVVFPSSEERR